MFRSFNHLPSGVIIAQNTTIFNKKDGEKMYRNLEAELLRKGMTQNQLAELLNLQFFYCFIKDKRQKRFFSQRSHADKEYFKRGHTS